MTGLIARMLPVIFCVSATTALAQDDVSVQGSNDSAQLQYTGDNVTLGIGYDSETDLTGELTWSFLEDSDSSWIGEAWLGNDGAGGLKLNFHWLTDAVSDETAEGVYVDGRVFKTFFAIDQNEFDDRKITLGGGGERENRFWSLYASRSTTGERFLGQTVDSSEILVTGMQGTHTTSRTDILEVFTDTFAHPYEWGVGFRVGKYFDSKTLRLRGGLDYEDGKLGASQTSAHLSLDKRFSGKPYGFSLRTEYVSKSGDFEIDKRDLRAGVFWTYDFGSNSRPARAYRDVEVEIAPEPPQPTIEVVSNQISIDSAATFNLDRSELTDGARQALDQLMASLQSSEIVGDISIVGHTCSLGSEEYNQGLSERRAQSVLNYMSEQGMNSDILRWEGRGELEPRYSNDEEETRRLNRRVEISFVTTEEVEVMVEVGEQEPIREWRQEPVAQEAAWIRRALRNPVRHKRTVDYYRTQRQTERLTQGETIVNNTGPAAVDDSFSFDQDSGPQVFNVLVNDSDPENDPLTIVSVTSASHGSVMITGSTIEYTSETGFFGTDSFTYTVEDGFGGMATATVSVEVLEVVIEPPENQAPIARDDFVETTKNGIVTINVLANDSDPDGDSLTVVSVTSLSDPPKGTITINPDNTVTYEPMRDWWGSDVFTYTISDGRGGEDTASVTLDVIDN